MENNADTNSPFQDLLSAALDEAGLADDFQDFGTEVPEPAGQTVQNSALIQPQHVLQTLQSPAVGLQQVTTQLHSAAVPQQQQVARVIRTVSAAGASPTTGNVRRVVVRAVRPQGVAGQVGQTVRLVRPQPQGPSTGTSTPQIRQAQVHTGQVQVVQGPTGPVKIIRVTPRPGQSPAVSISGTGTASSVASSLSLANIIGTPTQLATATSSQGTVLVSSQGTPSSAQGQPVRTRILQLAKAPGSNSGTPVGSGQVQRVIRVGATNPATPGSPVVVNLGGVKRQLLSSGTGQTGTATTVDASGVRRQVIRLDGSRGAALSQALANINPNAVKAQIVKVGSNPTATVATSSLPGTVMQQPINVVCSAKEMYVQTTSSIVSQTSSTVSSVTSTPSGRIPMRISNIAGQGTKIILRPNVSGANTPTTLPRTIKLVTVPQKGSGVTGGSTASQVFSVSPASVTMAPTATVAPVVSHTPVSTSPAPVVNPFSLSAIASNNVIVTAPAAPLIPSTSTVVSASEAMPSMLSTTATTNITTPVVSRVVMALPDDSADSVAAEFGLPPAKRLAVESQKDTEAPPAEVSVSSTHATNIVTPKEPVVTPLSSAPQSIINTTPVPAISPSLANVSAKQQLQTLTSHHSLATVVATSNSTLVQTPASSTTEALTTSPQSVPQTQNVVVDAPLPASTGSVPMPTLQPGPEETVTTSTVVSLDSPAVRTPELVSQALAVDSPTSLPAASTSSATSGAPAKIFSAETVNHQLPTTTTTASALPVSGSAVDVAAAVTATVSGDASQESKASVAPVIQTATDNTSAMEVVSIAQESTPTTSVVGQTATPDATQVTAATVPGTSASENDGENLMDMFGGTDIDIFSQALMQLQDTNVKAKEFEDYQKAKKPPTPPPAAVAKPTPVPQATVQLPVTPSNPSVVMPTTTSLLSTGGSTISSVLPSVVSPLVTGGVSVTARQFQPITLQSPLTSQGSVTVMSGIDSPEPLTSYKIGTSPLTVQRVNSPLTIQGVNVSSAQLVQRVNSPLTVQRVNSPLTVAAAGSPQLVQVVSRAGAGSPLTLQHSQIIKTVPGSMATFSRVLPGINNNIPSGSTPLKTILQASQAARVSSPLGGLSKLAMNPTKGPIIPIARTASVVGNGMIKKELTDKDVSRLWANDDIKLKKMGVLPGLRPGLHPSPSSPALMRGAEVLEEEAEEEDEELGHAETYAEYMPAKLKLGTKHPDPVVETSSLSSVEPVNIYYRISIPENIIDCGFLSALQLEAITYASQKHETFLPSGERAGFLIGDGAGVGKGRTIAGIIYENYLLGRKRSLWLSVSNDLRIDAQRDMQDIGAGKIEVHPLNKFKYGKISSHHNGSVKKGVIFATYSSLIGESQSDTKYRTRLKQLLHWLGKEFDGPIIFDECHKAKNLCPVGSSKPTKTGKTVLDLQNKLPKARIVYASATGASEPRNMAYMARLGLWGLGTPFREFSDFIQAVEKRGVGAMELVAMEMKLRGMYIARQLSFKGVAFRVEEIPIPHHFYKIYNMAVKLWVDARDKFQKAAEIMDPEHRLSKSMWGQFWSAHQRFFKYLCISAKVPHCVRMARDAVKNGKCVVIGLQSTGEARTLEQLEESGGELNDFVSTAKGVFQTLVEKHFPAPNRRKTNSLFGLGPSLLFDDSPVPSPKSASGSSKRRKDWDKKDSKRVKWQFSSDSSSDGSSDSDNSSDDSDDDGKGKENRKSESESDISLSESDEDEEEEEEDFNPFGNGSDSDDDPWLKRKKKSKPTKPAKEKKKSKESEEKPKKDKKKDKKKKKKKKKKSKKRRDNPWDDDGDNVDDAMDKQMDRALEAAGLKPSSGLNNRSGPSVLPGSDDVDKAISMKQELLDGIEQLEDLPPNTLDELIDQLGGPDYVAEMTGRKGRVVSTDDGVQYESRSETDVPLEILNLTEKQRFMDGDKDIAIISEAASSGISLQADRRAVNQKRRVHITLELPWSADRAVQQFGRTHRSNQVSAPEYLFMISELAGERRFASTVAKRLESLGALTHGDRRATESRDLSRFNIDNKYGRAALESIMKAVVDMESPMVPPPVEYKGNFFHDVKIGLVGVGMLSYDERFGMVNLEKDYNNISKFLNRILGMEVELQNMLFKYFTDTLEAIILQAKRNGRWDMGILDLGYGEEKVKRTDTRIFAGTFSGSKTKTELHTIIVERGTSWDKAMQIWRDHSGSEDGFYHATQVRNNKKMAVLVIAMSGKKRDRMYRLYRPNTGLQPRSETLEEIKKKYRKVYPDDAQQWWNDQYDASASVCTHAYWRGYCRKASLGMVCELGLRTRTYYVLGGSVLSVWNTVEGVLASLPGGHATRMQIIRMRTDEGKRIVGSLIPPSALEILINVLTAEVNKSKGSNNGPPAYGGSGGILTREYGGTGGTGNRGIIGMHSSTSSSASSPSLFPHQQVPSHSSASGGNVAVAQPVKSEPSQQQRQYISMPMFV